MTSESKQRLSLLAPAPRRSSGFPTLSSLNLSPLTKQFATLPPSNDSITLKIDKESAAAAINGRGQPLDLQPPSEKLEKDSKNLLPEIKIPKAEKKPEHRRLSLQPAFRRASLNKQVVKYHFNKEPNINQINSVNWNVEDDFWMDKAVKLRLVPARRKSQVYNMGQRHSLATTHIIKNVGANITHQSINRTPLPVISETDAMGIDTLSELPPLITKRSSQRRNTEPVGMNRDLGRFIRQRPDVLPAIMPGRNLETTEHTKSLNEPLKW